MTSFFKERGIDMPELYEQENENNPIAYAHFIKEAIDGRVFHWYVTEASERDGDVLLFGLVNMIEKELGYFTLNELASIGAGLDADFKPCGVYDIYDDFDLRRK